MRSQVLITVLLAVLPENVSAGLIRYHDRPVRHGHYIRSFNHSTVAVDASQSVEPTSVTSLFSTSQSPSATTAATALSKQIGSVPAEGSGESAAKIDPESLTQRLSSLATPPSSSAVPSSSQSKQIGSVPVQGSGPGAATFNLESFTQASSSASSSSSGELPTATSKTISDPQKVQSAGDSSNQSTNTLASATPSAVKPVSTFTTRLSLGTGIATTASQPQSSQVQPAASQSGAGSQSALSSEQAQSSSTAVAGSSAASVQSSGLTASSGSTASSSTQPSGPSLTAVPVITGGNVGIANAYNQQFKNLTPESPCNSKDRTQAHACINGLFAECNEAGRYTMTACAQGQQCFALPMPAESTGIFVQCDKPDDANQKLQSSSASSNTPIIESTTAVGVSLQTGNPTTVVPTILVSPAPQQSQGLDSTKLNSLLSITQTTSQTPTTSSATQPASAGASNAGQPGPASLLSPLTSATAASSSTNVPLIISFPSSLSSSSPQPSLQPSKPTALPNPTPAPAVPSPAVVPQSPTQASPSQQAPTPIPTIPAATSSAAAPGITIIPLGSDNGNVKGKTVTVSVTITERL
ncbi:MAG: hypothetical protein LQ343_003989 [Gyalolechia ehrenbergii]|nr:MAG: hypothetical protein LQ343_003989 [Gyalolechia ehrenbergii]